MCTDLDPCDVYRVEDRKARRRHVCCECSRGIKLGEQYQNVVMLYDGNWSTSKVCVHCKAAARWLDVVCGGYAIGGLYEELKEHWDEDWMYRTPWLGRAIIGMRRRWAGLSPLPDPVPELTRRGLKLSYITRTVTS